MLQCVLVQKKEWLMQMKSRLATKVFALAFLMAGVCQVFAAWDGKTSTRPETEKIGGKDFFLIKNEANLAWFRDSVNSVNGTITINAKLTASLDMGGKLFVPIAAGSGDIAYGGTFDGNGYTISNLYLNSDELGKIPNEYCPKNKPQCNAQNVGFVGILSGNGAIKNLNLENVNILASTNRGESGGEENPVSVGPFVGFQKGGSIESCFVSGSILTSGKGNSIGGLVGNMWSGGIVNGLSMVDIRVSGDESYVGGITGYVRKSGTVTFESCAYDGGVITNSGNGGTGGVVGFYEEGDLVVSRVYFDTDVVAKGLGKISDTLTVDGTMNGVKNINTAKVSCDLNKGQWTDACSETGVWSVGRSHISLNGVTLDDNGNIVYEVVFDANGGEYAQDAKYTKFLKTGALITADEISIPVRGDTVFGGWALTADANEPAASLGNVVTSTRIYAYWKTMFAITFDANGGTFSGEGNPSTLVKNVAEGDPIDVSGIDLPTTRTVEGTKYYFAGWAKTADATEAEALGDAIETVTFYAVWVEAPTYTVVFNTQKSVGSTVEYVQENGTVTKPADPEVPGYAFGGWFSDKECSEGNEVNFESPITVTENMTFFAKWTPETYKITYELSEGKNNEDNPASYTVESETVVFLKPSRSGYVFEGWYYDSRYTSMATQITQGSTGDKTVYAKWSVKTFTITYLAGAYGKEVVPSDIKQYDVPIKLRGSSYTRKGYLQDGWTTSDGSTKKVYDLDATYEKNRSLTLFPFWVVDPMSIGSKPAATVANFGMAVQNRNLEILNVKSGTRVSVMDMQGRLVRSGIAGSTGLKVQGLVPGNYVVRVNGQSRQVRVR